MKNNLGRVLLIFLTLLHVELFASTYEWSSSVNKQEAYVGEAIHLTYTCKFSDRAELYSIDFDPVGDYEKYTIVLLSEDSKLIDNKKVNNYEFVAYAKEAGKIEFNFDASMKKTNFDSIKNTVLGRDNAFYEEFTKEVAKQKTLHVDVLKPSTKLVGDFTLEVKKDKTQVKAYTPYHLRVVVRGNGDFENIKPIEFKIDGVKIFSSKMEKDFELTSDGFSGSISQKFAFVSSESFIIPELKIKYFNLKSKEEKTLIIESTEVKVIKGYEKKELLDEVEDKFVINYDYIYYFLFFVTGFLVSKIKFKRDEKLDSRDKEFREKVENAKSLNQLIVILALKDKLKYEEIILEIETNKVTSLSKAKSKTLSLI